MLRVVECDASAGNGDDFAGVVNQAGFRRASHPVHVAARLLRAGLRPLA
jgi:hypothetical protein